MMGVEAAVVELVVVCVTRWLMYCSAWRMWSSVDVRRGLGERGPSGASGDPTSVKVKD